MKIRRESHTKWCWVFLVLLCINLSLLNGADAFKIRSSKISIKHSKSDDQDHHERFVKVAASEENDDDDENEDEGEVETLENDKDDDDENEEEMKNLRRKTQKASSIFEKVRKARNTVRAKKGDVKEKSKGGIGSKILGWFGKKDEEEIIIKSDVNEPPKVDKPKQKQVVAKKENESPPPQESNKGKSPKKRKSKGIKAYLEKLPLGFLFDFISEGQSNEDDDDEPESGIEVPKPLKPTEQIVEDLKKSVKEKAAQKHGANKKKPSPSIPHEEFERLLMNIPSFVPNYTRIHNFECKMQGEIFERQLKGHKPWTLQMIDSSAKITSGLMRGNMNQLGDYDMCTKIATKVKVTQTDAVNIRGKYCLAHIDVTAFEDGLKGPLHLIQGKGFMKSSLDDVSIYKKSII